MCCQRHVGRLGRGNPTLDGYLNPIGAMPLRIRILAALGRIKGIFLLHSLARCFGSSPKDFE